MITAEVNCSIALAHQRIDIGINIYFTPTSTYVNHIVWYIANMTLLLSIIQIISS